MRAKPAGLAALAGLVLVIAAFVSTTSAGLDWTGSAGRVVEEDDRRQPQPDHQADNRSEDEGQSDTPGRSRQAQDPNLPLNALGVLLAVALVLISTVALAGWLKVVRRRRQLDGTIGVRGSGDADPQTDPSADDEVAELLGAPFVALAEGTPRNAIVAAWVQLEGAVESARFTRRLSDTSTEFVERALATYSLDEEVITRLAGLYREARFSLHELTEEHRQEAQACLLHLHHQLTRAGSR